VGVAVGLKDGADVTSGAATRSVGSYDGVTVVSELLGALDNIVLVGISVKSRVGIKVGVSVEESVVHSRIGAEVGSSVGVEVGVGVAVGSPVDVAPGVLVTVVKPLSYIRM
jgi:hypothetical protein